MKLSLLSFAALLGSTAALLDETKYFIASDETGLTVSYDAVNDKFTASLANAGGSAGNGETGFNIEFHDKCGHGDPDSNTPIIELDPSSLSWLAVTSGPSATGGGPFTTSWDFTIGAGVSGAGPTVYTGPSRRELQELERQLGSCGTPTTPTCPPCDKQATVKMCVKASIATAATGGLVANFREVELTVTYDMCGYFNPVDIQAQAYVPETSDAGGSIQFGVEAHLCSGFGPVFNQGQTVCIEVCPVADDLDMIKVTEILEMDVQEKADGVVTANEGSSPDTQMIWNNAAGGTLTISQTADVGTQSKCVQTRFLLKEIFFPWDTAANILETQDYSYPECSGEVTIAFLSSRRLSDGGRALQQETAKFNTNFVLAKDADSGSYSVQFGGATVAAAGLLGAAALAL